MRVLSSQRAVPNPPLSVEPSGDQSIESEIELLEVPATRWIVAEPAAVAGRVGCIHVHAIGRTDQSQALLDIAFGRLHHGKSAPGVCAQILGVLGQVAQEQQRVAARVQAIGNGGGEGVAGVRERVGGDGRLETPSPELASVVEAFVATRGDRGRFRHGVPPRWPFMQAVARPQAGTDALACSGRQRFHAPGLLPPPADEQAH